MGLEEHDLLIRQNTQAIVKKALERLGVEVEFKTFNAPLLLFP